MRWESKRPGEVRVYSHDWSDFLGSDTIATSTFSVTGATKDSESNTATAATVQISGGTLGATVAVTNTITTAGGQTEIEVFEFTVSGFEEPISVQEAKEHLRVTDTHEDSLIRCYISAAREWVEQYTGHFLAQRDVVTTFDSFGDELRLYQWPVNSVEEIAYTDANGDPATYDDGILWSAAQPAVIRPPTNEAFPGIADDTTIVVTVSAGYAPTDVPAPLRQAMLLLIGTWHGNRQAISPDAASEVPFAVTALCRPYRGAVLA